MKIERCSGRLSCAVQRKAIAVRKGGNGWRKLAACLRIITSVILNCRGNDTKADFLFNTHNGKILVELLDVA